VGVYHKRTFLDWFKSFGYLSPHGTDTTDWAPSTDWSQGGPIIEREGIGLIQYREGEVDPEDVGTWCASYVPDAFGLEGISFHGPTPLIAAMRCFVASKLGDEVEVPDELA
jgi:hypothetical protein